MARNTLAPGGYIGGEPPRRPYFNQLSGVWKLEDAMERQRAGTWANPLGIEDLFSTYLYTGNGSTQTITNGIDLAGEGGLVWIKIRTNVGSHALFDTVRGATKDIRSNSTNAESSNANYLTAFNSNGFSLGSDNLVNSGGDYASWTFRKAEKFFDVVTYTGNGTTLTVNHSLGSTPGCIIVKNTSNVSNWVVYHRSLTIPNNYYLRLNSGTAETNVSTNRWNVTSTTFNADAFSLDTNNNGENYVAYLFAHDAGGFGDSGDESVIKCGSYTGTGAAGNFVNLGWEPQWVLIKTTNGNTAGWAIFDNMRGVTTGGTEATLLANSSNAENGAGVGTNNFIDFESTGFSLNTGFSLTNDAGVPFIYIAIRRGPMKAPTVGTQVFSSVARAGTGTNNLVVNTTVQPDAILQTYRNTGAANDFWDRLRGAGRNLQTTGTAAEGSNAPNYGPQLFANTSYTQGNLDGSNYNSSGNTFIDWVFRRAPGFFDVVAYTGTGSAKTVAHNLGVAPELMIVKQRGAGVTGAHNWRVYHSAIGNTKSLYLNRDESEQTESFTWNNTSPTATVFTVGAGNAVNEISVPIIAYLFATCPGVSKVGSYTGNGFSTQDIACGFTAGARFVLIKRTDSTGDWYVWDTARGIVSGDDPYLLFNSTAAEVTSINYINPLNSGFTVYGPNAWNTINVSGATYIFLAIA